MQRASHPHEDEVAERRRLYRSTTPAERLRAAFRASRFGTKLKHAALRASPPR